MSAESYLLSRRRTRLAMSGALLGTFLATQSQTAVTTALPYIVGELGGMEHYSWVFTSYILAMAVTTPIFGRMSDIHGRRKLFMTGVCLFMIGAAIGATAGSMTQLIVGRTIQGLGTGAIVPMTLAIAGDLVAPSERGRWQAPIGVVIAVAAISGPLSGGIISDHASWRWVFLAVLPFGLLALVTAAATLRIPLHPDRDTRIDYLGAAMLATGLSSGLVAITQGGPAGLYVLATVGLAAFVVHERRVPQPLIPLELFARRSFATCNGVAFMGGAALFCAFMFVPLYVQEVLGESATAAGLVLMPMLLATVTATIGSGQVIARTGRYRWALILGPALLALGYLALALMDTDSTRGDATAAAVLLGFGTGLVAQNLVLVVQNDVPTRHLGAATSAMHFSRSVGGTISVTVMGAILAANRPSDPTASELAHAIQPIFVLAVPLMAAMLLAALLIPELPLRTTPREPAAPLSTEVTT